jgi:hypothetical protein
MIKQFAVCILEKEIHYPTDDDSLNPEKMIDAVRNYDPPKAEYGERMAHCYAHAVDTVRGYQKRMAFLAFAQFYNFSTISALDPSTECQKTFEIPDDMCVFESLMFHETFEIEKDPRFRRIVNRVAELKNINDASELWKRVTGLTSGVIMKRKSECPTHGCHNSGDGCEPTGGDKNESVVRQKRSGSESETDHKCDASEADVSQK